MSTTSTQTKEIRGKERLAALAAIQAASREHKHVAIRPKGKRGPEGRRAIGVHLLTSFNSGKTLDRGISDAARAWPNCDDWEVFGADEFEPWDEDEDTPGDGLFYAPVVYGEFSTVPEADQQ